MSGTLILNIYQIQMKNLRIFEKDAKYNIRFLYIINKWDQEKEEEKVEHI